MELVRPAAWRSELPRIRLSILLILLCFFAEGVPAPQTNLTLQQYEADFDYLWQSLADDYAYFDQKQTDWNKVREIYRPQLSAVKMRNDFVVLLEAVLEELYDFHAHLNTNTASSPRLVPSGADIWAEWINERAIITEVKPESAADKAGLRVGMEIVSVNGDAVAAAVSRRVGKAVRTSDKAVRDWALRSLLAGRHNENRSVAVRSNGEPKVFAIANEPDTGRTTARPLLAYRRVEKDLGYIRINNSLGDIELVKQFGLALTALRNTHGLILDLRDTPGGGNTTVARGIMGRFIKRDLPYQKHSIPAEERQYGVRRSWIELVSSGGDFTYSAPVVVLVNHWTGSMGEGIAIGMDGMKRATVVGTEMARLAGATSGIKLPHTGIGVTFPTEKLFHVNGTPREKFVPPVYVDLLKRGNQQSDVVMTRGQAVLRSMLKRMGSQ